LIGRCWFGLYDLRRRLAKLASNPPKRSLANVVRRDEEQARCERLRIERKAMSPDELSE
jgi:hypothetical protein